MVENNGVDICSLTPIDSIRGEDEEETSQLHNLYDKAEKFVTGFKWCKKISCAYLGYGLGDILGVFLFEIEPSLPDVDACLWVIVGDIPSAYLVTDEAKNPADALKIYTKLFREWITAVRAGKSVKKLIPANAAPTEANAALLESRLDFLERNILPQVMLVQSSRGPRCE